MYPFQDRKEGTKINCYKKGSFAFCLMKLRTTTLNKLSFRGMQYYTRI